MMEQQKSSSGVSLTGGICFSCEQIFSSQTFLEQHVCPSASYICSCGTEFSKYADMLNHNSTHEPGQQVLDHETIRKRRFAKHIEEEEKLKRFKSGQVVWKVQKADSGPAASLSLRPAPMASASLLPNTMRSSQTSQVPSLYPSSSLLSKPRQAGTGMQKMFSEVGAPTVDLWTLYQPVVLVQTVHQYNKWKPYTCGKCGEGFINKRMLISHAYSHVTDKVSGCIGCGLLLSSRKLVPRFHVCNSPNSTAKLKIVTARPLNYKRPITSIDLTQESPRPHATYVNKNKSRQMLQVTSALQLKNLNIRTYTRNSQGPHVSTSQQLKKQNSIVNMPHNTVASNKSNWKRPSSPAMSLLSQPVQTPSDGDEFTCRVCHIPFDSTQQLQRHKCAKAEEFMAKHGRFGKLIKPRRIMTTVSKPNVTQVNGEINHTFPAGGNKEQVSSDKGAGKADTGDDFEDDCYIVESQPEKPAEMIYQVTSSVPIKT
ncbi:zinc finger protein 93-like [Dunckerocampus dactyliophorus]|uniref:zinc finger protein 93-like n=1 Tax=Dunckerocampus dactyliophorus TaxID=161453 RepID=UPI002404E581|nr:zinc finger protein 93-like [Dunckerocampus dactyliophorus]